MHTTCGHTAGSFQHYYHIFFFYCNLFRMDSLFWKLQGLYIFRMHNRLIPFHTRTISIKVYIICVCANLISGLIKLNISSNRKAER